jgi:hypothetical protein
MSVYLGNKLCNWLNGVDMPPGLTDGACVGLFNGNPKTGGTEVTTSVRPLGRVAIDFEALTDDTDNTLVNTTDTDFGNSAGDVASIDYVAVFDGPLPSPPANLLFSKALPGGPYAITTGAPVKFLAGDLSFTLGSAT